MWLLIESVEERANKTGTITHTQGDGQSSGYTHACICTLTHTLDTQIKAYGNTLVYTHKLPTHCSCPILNKSQTYDKLHEPFLQSRLSKFVTLLQGLLIWNAKRAICLITLVLRNEAITWTLIAQHLNFNASVPWMTADHKSDSWQCGAQTQPHRHNHNQDIAGRICMFCIHSDPCLTEYIKHARWHVHYCASQHTLPFAISHTFSTGS